MPDDELSRLRAAEQSQAVQRGTTLAEQGFDCLRAQHFTAAIGKFSEALQILGLHETLLLGRAGALCGVKNYEGARFDLEACLKLNPANTQASDLARQIDALGTTSPQSEPHNLENEAIAARSAVSSSSNLIYPTEIQAAPDFEPLHVSILEKAAILGPSALLLSSERKILKESVIQRHLKDAINHAGQALQQNNLPHLPGDYVALCGLWSDAFYHFVLENLPRALLAEKAGFKGRYLVPAGRRFVHEALALIGIGAERIIEWHQQSCTVDRLFVSSAVPGHDMPYYPGLVSMLRAALLQGAGVSSGATSKRRLMVLRQDYGQGRRLSNLEEVSSLTAPYGFEPILFDKLSLKEQIRTAAEASALIGPHGAGFVHTMFMQPASLIIEFFSSYYVNPCVLSICKELRHRYFMQVMDSYRNRAELMCNDVMVETSLLSMTLERELGANPATLK